MEVIAIPKSDSHTEKIIGVVGKVVLDGIQESVGIASPPKGI